MRGPDTPTDPVPRLQDGNLGPCGNQITGGAKPGKAPLCARAAIGAAKRAEIVASRLRRIMVIWRSDGQAESSATARKA